MIFQSFLLLDNITGEIRPEVMKAVVFFLNFQEIGPPNWPKNGHFQCGNAWGAGRTTHGRLLCDSQPTQLFMVYIKVYILFCWKDDRICLVKSRNLGLLCWLTSNSLMKTDQNQLLMVKFPHFTGWWFGT